MTQLNEIYSAIDTALNFCHDFNGSDELVSEQQATFFDFSERIITMMNDMNTNFDTLSACLIDKPDDLTELSAIWGETNVALTTLTKLVTVPNIDSAVLTTETSIGRTSTILCHILIQ